ncbi:hypothetical protein PSHT_02177 [Puccinia striiformis]|uniref:Uncharacterized protein n=1 Tax=Puccinia striiformis TaxID=27350 RepID=A0A2S4WIM9_9BASI|nr:hypothetical protein PSHT_02177 [Puccinia striiformis]
MIMGKSSSLASKTMAPMSDATKLPLNADNRARFEWIKSNMPYLNKELNRLKIGQIFKNTTENWALNDGQVYEKKPLYLTKAEQSFPSLMMVYIHNQRSGRLPPKSSSTQFQNENRFKWNIQLLDLSDVVICEEGHLLPWLFITADLKQKFGMKKKEGLRLPHLFHASVTLQIASDLEECWFSHNQYHTFPDIETHDINPSKTDDKSSSTFDKPRGSPHVNQEGASPEPPTT